MTLLKGKPRSIDSVNIASAALADIPQLMLLERSCPTAAHWTEHQYNEALKDEALQAAGCLRLVLVAKRNSQKGLDDREAASPDVVGFLVARDVAAEWELENIVVAGGARRMGVGLRLLEALLGRLGQMKATAVFLEVRESNWAARNLYESAGFSATGRRKLYYANPAEDAVLYRLFR